MSTPDPSHYTYLLSFMRFIMAGERGSNPQVRVVLLSLLCGIFHFMYLHTHGVLLSL